MDPRHRTGRTKIYAYVVVAFGMSGRRGPRDGICRKLRRREAFRIGFRWGVDMSVCLLDCWSRPMLRCDQVELRETVAAGVGGPGFSGSDVIVISARSARQTAVEGVVDRSGTCDCSRARLKLQRVDRGTWIFFCASSSRPRWRHAATTTGLRNGEVTAQRIAAAE